MALLLTEPELVDLHTNAAAARPDAFLQIINIHKNIFNER